MVTQGKDCNGCMRYIIQVMNYEDIVPRYSTCEFYNKKDANEYFKKNFEDYKLTYTKKGTEAA